MTRGERREAWIAFAAAALQGLIADHKEAGAARYAAEHADQLLNELHQRRGLQGSP